MRTVGERSSSVSVNFCCERFPALVWRVGGCYLLLFGVFDARFGIVVKNTGRRIPDKRRGAKQRFSWLEDAPGNSS